MNNRSHAKAARGSSIRTVIVQISRKLRATYRVRTGRLFSRLIAALLGVYAAQVFALPQGGVVQAGAVTINTPSANSMVLNQGTQKAVIDWQSFSIGAGQSVQFLQPGASSVALNRVVGGDVSSIFGTLSANGQVFLVNPAGVLFAPGAQVNVGGLVASTLNLSNADFLAGKYSFSGDSGASVVNNGMIRAGYVALAGAQVSNAGTIEAAQGGSVGLLAGSRVTVDPVGAGLVKFSVDGAAVEAAASNSGTIVAEGGQVLMAAQAVGDTLATVINQSGVIRANSVAENNGVITLSGGANGIVNVSGTLEAKGDNAGETGGTVKVLGDKVGLMAGATVDASGDAGGGTVLVGGNFQGNGPEQNANRTYVDQTARIKADAGTLGDGGKVIVWADEVTRYNGSISAKGGANGGAGGFAEVSGKQSLVFTGEADLSAANGTMGTLLLDPTDINIVNGGGDTTKNYGPGDEALAFTDAPVTANIDASTLTALNAAITLQATNDITISEAVALTNQNFVAMAGRSVNVNANISTGTGVIALTAASSASGIADPLGKVTIDAAATLSGKHVTLMNDRNVTANVVNGTITATDNVNLFGSANLNGLINGTSLNVHSGTATLGASNLINNGAALTVESGGTLAMSTFSDTVATTTLNNGTISGTGTLTAATTTLNGGTVGANLAGAVLTQATNTTTLNGIASQTTVNVTGGQLTLGNTVNRLTGAGAAITVNAGAALNTGTASQALGGGTGTLANNGTLVAGGAVSAASISGTGKATLGGNVTTTGGQTYTTTTLASSGLTLTASALDLGTVNGGGLNLTTDAGTTTIAGTGTKLGNLAVIGELALVNGGTLAASSVNVAATSSLGGAVITSGAQTYAGAITLTGDVTLDTTDDGALPAGANVSAGAVTGNDHHLTINAGTAGAVTSTYVAGANDFRVVNSGSAAVGGIVNTATVNSTGAVTLHPMTVAGTATLIAGGTLTQTGALRANTLTGSAASAILNNAGNAIVNLGSFSASSGLAVSSGGAMTVTGAVNGGAGATTIGAGGNLAVNNTVSGTSVILGAEGAGASITLAGNVNASGLAKLTADKDITRTAGTITALSTMLTAVNGGVTADVSTTTLEGSAGTSATITGNAGMLDGFSTGTGFTMTDAGGLTVRAGVTGGTGAASITTTGSALTVNANVTGQGVTLAGRGVTQAAATSVNAGAGDVTVDGNDGAIHLAGAIVTSSNTGAAVRIVDATTAALGNITTGAAGTVTLGAASGDNLSGAVTQNAGAKISTGTVTVNGGSSVVLAGANTVATLGPVTGNGAFSFSNAGALAVAGAVNAGTGGVTLQTTAGALDILAAGDITAGNAVSLTGAAGIRTAGDITASTGGVTYNSPATLTGAVTIDAASFTAATLDGGGNDLTLTGAGALANATNIGTFTAGSNATLDGSIGAVTYNLRGGTVTAALGTGTLNQVSGTTTLGGTSAAGTVNVNGGTLALGGTADRLTGVTTLAIANGATLNTGAAAQALGTATVTSNGTLVSGNAISAGSITSSGTASYAGDVTTTGAQTYTGSLGTAAGSTIAAAGNLSSAQGAATTIGDGTTLRLNGAGTVNVAGNYAGAVKVDGGATSVTLSDLSAATPFVVNQMAADPSASVTLNAAGALTVDAANLSPMASLNVRVSKGDAMFLNSTTLRNGQSGVLASGGMVLQVDEGNVNTQADPMWINTATPNLSLTLSGAFKAWLAGNVSPGAVIPQIPPAAPNAPAAPVAPNVQDAQNVQNAQNGMGASRAQMARDFLRELRRNGGVGAMEDLVLSGGIDMQGITAPLNFNKLAVKLPQCAGEQAGSQQCN